VTANLQSFVPAGRQSPASVREDWVDLVTDACLTDLLLGIIVAYSSPLKSLLKIKNIALLGRLIPKLCPFSRWHLTNHDDNHRLVPEIDLIAIGILSQRQDTFPYLPNIGWPLED